jgi:hypothetical protein
VPCITGIGAASPTQVAYGSVKLGTLSCADPSKESLIERVTTAAAAEIGIRLSPKLQAICCSAGVPESVAGVASAAYHERLAVPEKSLLAKSPEVKPAPTTREQIATRGRRSPIPRSSGR